MNKRAFLEKLMDVVIAGVLLILAFLLIALISSNEGKVEKGMFENSMKKISSSHELVQFLQEQRQDEILTAIIDPVNDPEGTKSFFSNHYSQTYFTAWRVNILYEENGKEKIIGVQEYSGNRDYITGLYLPRFVGQPVEIEILLEVPRVTYVRSMVSPSSSPAELVSEVKERDK